MSGYFYAIGGANYEKKESLKIDLDIISQSKKKNPNVLLIAAAINDDINKVNTFKSYYESLGCNVKLLPSIKSLSENEIITLFDSSDIIYLSGGITTRLLEYAKSINLQKLLINAYKNGKIIAGVSAGAILLFSYGYGDKDAFIYNLETTNHHITNGLGILCGIFCPHYQNSGLLSFHEEVKKYPFNGFALENGASLKICEDGFIVIKEKGSSAFLFDKDKNYQLQYLKENVFYNLNLFKHN